MENLKSNNTTHNVTWHKDYVKICKCNKHVRISTLTFFSIWRRKLKHLVKQCIQPSLFTTTLTNNNTREITVIDALCTSTSYKVPIHDQLIFWMIFLLNSFSSTAKHYLLLDVYFGFIIWLRQCCVCLVVQFCRASESRLIENSVV